MPTTDVLSSLSSLPSYDHVPPTPRAPVEPPTYSSEPGADEETVAHTPRAGTSTSPQGSFSKQWPQATLTLKDQDETARLPTYGRYGRITGELELKDTTSIVSVIAELTGTLSASTTDKAICLFCETQVIWKRDQSSSPQCPTMHPVFFEIPATYEENGKQWQMPPSFEVTFLGIQAMLVRVTYVLSITVTRSKLWKTRKKKKTYVTPVHYHPKSRPARPINMVGTVFASIKPAPEDWCQITGRMEVRPTSKHKTPIECQVFIPSIQTFALSDTIPFHLQLISSLESLQELLPPSSGSSLLLPSDCQIGASITNCGKCDGPLSSFPAIRFFLARHVLVEVDGMTKSRIFTIGQGNLWPVPPLSVFSGQRVDYDCSVSEHQENNLSADVESKGRFKEVSLDWRGEVKCWPEIQVGGLFTSHLSVKDLLVISLTPPNPRTSFLVPLQLSHPIKLVTDSWVENALHPNDF